MRGRVHARRTLKGLVADLRQVRKYKELTATEKLKYRIAVKMTAADYFRLLTRSHEAGVSPSEYMRECFRNGHVKERLSEEHAGYIRQLCGMANNLNQLARRANETGRIYPEDLADIRQNQAQLWESAKEILRVLSKLD